MSSEDPPPPLGNGGGPADPASPAAPAAPAAGDTPARPGWADEGDEPAAPARQRAVPAPASDRDAPSGSASGDATSGDPTAEASAAPRAAPAAAPAATAAEHAAAAAAPRMPAGRASAASTPGVLSDPPSIAEPPSDPVSGLSSVPEDMPAHPSMRTLEQHMAAAAAAAGTSSVPLSQRPSIMSSVAETASEGMSTPGAATPGVATPPVKLESRLKKKGKKKRKKGKARRPSVRFSSAEPQRHLYVLPSSNSTAPSGDPTSGVVPSVAELRAAILASEQAHSESGTDETGATSQVTGDDDDADTAYTDALTADTSAAGTGKSDDDGADDGEDDGNGVGSPAFAVASTRASIIGVGGSRRASMIGGGGSRRPSHAGSNRINNPIDEDDAAEWSDMLEKAEALARERLQGMSLPGEGGSSRASTSHRPSIGRKATPTSVVGPPRPRRQSKISPHVYSASQIQGMTTTAKHFVGDEEVAEAPVSISWKQIAFTDRQVETEFTQVRTIRIIDHAIRWTSVLVLLLLLAMAETLLSDLSRNALATTLTVRCGQFAVAAINLAFAKLLSSRPKPLVMDVNGSVPEDNTIEHLALGSLALMGYLEALALALSPEPRNVPWILTVVLPVGLVVSRTRLYAAWLFLGSQLFMLTVALAAAETGGLRLLSTVLYALVSFSACLMHIYFAEVTLRKQYSLSRRLSLRFRQSEELLQMMLPGPIVTMHTSGERVQHTAMVTVIFVTIGNFHEITSAYPPADQAALLDGLFGLFDDLGGVHGVQKIENVLNSYVAVCGILSNQEDHVQRIAEFACDVLEVAGVVREDIKVKVGVHSGEVVGGLVGSKRLFYRIFGDTVNTASRMSSKSRPGQVVVSKTSADLLRAGPSAARRFSVTPLGLVAIKGKGPMELFIVSRKRSSVHATKVTSTLLQHSNRSHMASTMDIARKSHNKQSALWYASALTGKRASMRPLSLDRSRALKSSMLGDSRSRMSHQMLHFLDAKLERDFQRTRTREILGKAHPFLFLLLGLLLAFVLRDVAELLAGDGHSDMYWIVRIGVALVGILACGIAAFMAERIVPSFKRLVNWNSLMVGVAYLAMAFFQIVDSEVVTYAYCAIAMVQLLLAQMSYVRHMVLFASGALVYAVTAMVVLVDRSAPIRDMIFVVCIAITVSVLCWSTIRTIELGDRMTLMLMSRLAEARRKLERLVFDLLPRPIVREIVTLEEQRENEKKEQEARRKSSVGVSGIEQRLLGHYSAAKLPSYFTLARVYRDVLVIQLDLVGFTALSAKMEPADVFLFLDRLYSLFDRITDEQDVYKLDTIGDMYVVVAGLFENRDEQLAHRVIKTAIAFQKSLDHLTPHKKMQEQMAEENRDKIDCRIGIGLGNIVGAVIGKSMPKFCCWGPVVTEAERLEQSCPVGRIHISGDVTKLCADKFSFEDNPDAAFFSTPNSPLTLGQQHPPSYLLSKSKDATATYWTH